VYFIPTCVWADQLRESRDIKINLTDNRLTDVSRGRKTESIEFFCYHRDRPASVALRDQLLEEHWSYMDRCATQMIARGPTLASDDTPTGSVHIVDLPDPAAARAFPRQRRLAVPHRRGQAVRPRR